MTFVIGPVVESAIKKSLKADRKWVVRAAAMPYLTDQYNGH
ncbi:MAG: hypothetical protein OSA82_00300 [Paracoccaceae bacterium]|nr:hypothetical protein [Paracoccaceae bacterium]